jgi:shikimate kinase
MNKRNNLVLLGFMGTGKSAAGRRVAELAGRPFLDMDAELERRAGRSIPRIFAEEGEAAFRRMESQLAEEWGQREGAVIACGGGVVLREENLSALGRNGVLVCLAAPPEVILERTSHSRKRPLLEGEDREKKIRELLAVRGPLYAKIPIQIDTSTVDLETLAKRLLDVWDQAP